MHPALLQRLTRDQDVQRPQSEELAESPAVAAAAYQQVTASEAKVLLSSVHTDYDQMRMAEYLADARGKVLAPLIQSFGLASVIFRDKPGGNVTTPHNAAAQVFAQPRDALRYNQPYDRAPLDRHKDKRRKAAFAGNAPIMDGYRPDVELARDSHTEFDHVVPGKQLYDDPWLRLSTDEQQRAKIANTPNNVVPTHRAVNRSKGPNDERDWAKKTRPDGTLVTAELGVDPAALSRVGENARAAVNPKILAAKVRHFGGEVCKTGVSEGLKMGIQQAIGLLLMELAESLWDELRDVIASGRVTSADETVIAAIARRLGRVGRRVIAKWRDAVAAFKDGAISGFLTNLLTFVVNSFITTGRNVVRIIREGGMSVTRAFNIIFFPPEGLTRSESYHEAGKLILAGVGVGLGVTVEEFVRISVASIPAIGALSNGISAVLVGIATGLGISLLCYLWDRLDMFGAERERRTNFITKTLDEKIVEQSSLADEAEKECRILLNTL